ncbi:MAG: hypothetical protein RL522_2008 [Pseudomonadota bacterium]|jgi:DNA-binding IclR family transcriptional regulator
MDSTLAKGLRVLEWLARQPEGVRLSEVADAMALARSNAHRALQTLVLCGWAVQDAADSRYRASLKLFELGSLVDGVTDLKTLLHPVLGELARTTGETIHLARLQGAEILYLDKFDSPLPVAAYSQVGGRAAAHCVASGKALLAALNLDKQALTGRMGTLQAHTKNTITQIEQFHADLVRAQARGWAENREEWRLGVCGLGAPVFNARSEPVAAIGMSVPSIRFTRSRANELGVQLRDCALRASAALGFDARPPVSALASRKK